MAGLENEARRREREIQATLEKIKMVQQKSASGWRLDIPMWKLSLEGICLFMMAFLMGLGFAVLYEIIAP